MTGDGDVQDLTDDARHTLISSLEGQDGGLFESSASLIGPCAPKRETYEVPARTPPGHDDPLRIDA
jgi:hypothetical protein